MNHNYMDRDDMDRLVQYRDFLYRRAITWDEQAHTPPVSNDDFRDKGRSQGSYDALSELHRTFP